MHLAHQKGTCFGVCPPSLTNLARSRFAAEMILNVDLHGPGAAQALKLTALQYPKQLGLEFQRQGVDLIFVFIYISYLFFYQNIDCLSIRFCQFYRDLLT
jgi:hypothetical protein